MAERRLTADEAALWQRVMATVTPIAPADAKPFAAPPPATRKPVTGLPRPASAPKPPTPVATPQPGTTLDGSWDRKLSSGAIAPDITIDLHGHTVESAYTVLDQGLDRAIARGDRVLLLITGRPPKPESKRPHARGRIRAAVGDWLAASRHAAHIAAVRGAHPRHGGVGALYIILRRPRPARNY